MKKQQKIDFIALEKLQLDGENPRLPSSYQGKTEGEIIQWMLSDASIIELMLAIGQNGFFIGEALLVVKDGNNYTVVEGNRRLTSLKLLKNHNLATVHKQKIQQVLGETHERPKSIPCIVFESRESIMKYLGYRHITGIKQWGMLAKAKHLNSLLSTLETDNLKEQSIELAKAIGSRADYVKRMLVSYQIYTIIEDAGFYKIPKLNANTFYFNYIADSLRHEGIKKFIGVDLQDDKFSGSNLDIDNLKMLMHWFFEKNDQNISRVLGNSKDLTNLNNVLSDPEITRKFIDGMSLSDVVGLIEIDSGTFTHGLDKALKELRNANGYIDRIQAHSDRDQEILIDIVNVCKVIKGSIANKSDNWDIEN